ncbi:hypothetical protein ES965_21465 (plasmid) [Bacillus subtilis]|uniref:hypothetical protein n=1 Tax=Bacillus subtilis TaxID=1423 RepID=UPI00100A138A|nr:hypothetical protein [Bacillus subtilis]QAV85215.1 hypothetical protein ES965_14485 [Bacillus subtilis]QAV86648.1 hypothetical protein ES965_21465 [Bacillus subtilis]WJD91328.1 hypothetical protein QR321_14435 [Bacillus spizizenii]
MKPKFAIGDIVAVDGYKDRIFYVDCWREVTQHEEYGAFDYVEYDLTDAINGEWLEADSDDLRLVCRKAASEDFLMTYDMTNYPEPTNTSFHFTEINFAKEEAVGMAKEPKETPKTARAASAQEVAKRKRETDELLDKYIDLMTLYELIGDEDYKTYADAVMTKLKREAGE